MRSQYRETVIDDPRNPVIFYYDPETGSDIPVTTFPAPGYTVEEVVANDIPKAAKWYVCEYQELPPRQIFRDAWRISDMCQLEVDAKAAKEIALEDIKRLWQDRILREGLALPEPFLSAADLEKIASYAATYKQNVARITGTASVQELYALQDQGVLSSEPEF